MTTDIVIPKLGMTMEKATINAWLAGEGDRVDVGQPVLVIETEKVTYEVEALDPGLLHILREPGYVAMVGEAVGRLAGNEAELVGVQQAEPGPESSAAPTREAAPVPEKAPDQALPPGPAEKVKISPLARKMAGQHNLDIRKITGTGPGGRIKVKDVEEYLEGLNSGQASAPAASEAPAAAAVWAQGEIDGKRVKDRLALTGLRGAVAEHMLRSLAVSAQLTTMGEFDATELVRMREILKARAEVLGARISYTDILVYILARVLKRNPIINSSIVGSEIVLWEDVHIGVAVSMPWEQYDAGLIVPVIRNADQKSLVQISLEMKELRDKAASGRLGLEDITGGTFTLSNVGSFGQGYMFSTPIINQPQAAILLTGSIVERPLIVNGQITARSVMNWSFTFDHRAINGAPVGKFIGEVAECIESPYIMLA